MNGVTRILFCCILILSHQESYCVTTHHNEDFIAGKITMAEYANTPPISKQELRKQKKEERLLQRVEGMIFRFEKVLHTKMQKKSINSISDPIDRWFWIWGISWGTGMLITILAGGGVAAAGVGILWLLAFSVGAVALILWLIKKFG
ncbi:MAG TPA: hypothetical protein VLA46_06800 [Saprospiraceae bacterium]|nr:hypothetical protein [Saprospiraceae bacterium]